MRVAAFLTAVVLLATPAAAPAEEMRVEPGNWEFTVTTPGAAAMQGIPTSKTYTECLREEDMTPQRFTTDMRGCRLSEPVSDAQSMSWKMSCPSPAGEMRGSGSFRSTGTTISGSMQISMNAAGQQFDMRTTWTGRRIGDCQ